MFHRQPFAAGRLPDDALHNPPQAAHASRRVSPACPAIVAVSFSIPAILTLSLMTPDPRLSPDQVARLSSEILKCQRLLRKLWSEDSRREVMARRRSLYRILYDVPQGIPVPIDWAPDPHRPEGELVVLPAEAFDALASRLEQPGHYDPRVARVLSRKAPWE
jgi:hypothetical protein